MIKCFLSHSSKDKAGYVRLVASLLKKDATIFDEETFEEGMSPIEEISRGLDESSLFVLFLSSTALDSKWVREELAGAKKLFDAEKLDRIYPILIEEKIDHTDPRIPQWMRDTLNIKPILSPKSAARKINARLLEIAWKHHPSLKERQEIFVGRNDYIKAVEERLDDFSRQAPAALIASGLPAIGRKSFLVHAARKANLVRDSFSFPIIPLSAHDSIEDFILKLDDLGFSNDPSIRAAVSGSMEEKIQAAKKLALKIVEEKERILIEDHGTIVQRDAEIVDWFQSIAQEVAVHNFTAFFIASTFRARGALNTHAPYYVTHVGELERSERNGLLARYASFNKLELSREDLSFFSALLTGFPEQVLFCVDLIKSDGIFEARKLSHLVQQYASDKANIALNQLGADEKLHEFIHLLSKFEFISYDVLFDIVPEDEYFPLLQKLLSHAICERIGAAGEYIRVNEAIRDYISRSRFGAQNRFEEAIRRHVNGFIVQYSDDDADVSDYLFSAKEKLLRGEQLPSEVVIPSVFIKVIKKLYDEDRNYLVALALTDRVLINANHLHVNTIEHVRFIKCQCLARLRRSGDFFGEVKHISEPDRSFLHGFYYRISGDLPKAEASFRRVLDQRPNDSRSMGELVLIYMQSEEHELAFDLARNNYINKPGNPINANNYFACLLHRDKTDGNRRELLELIERMSVNPADRAREMVASAKAKMLAYYDNDRNESLNCIDQAIRDFPDITYPLLTKSEIAVYFRDEVALKEALSQLDKVISKHAQTYRMYIRFKAMHMAMSGKLIDAKRLVNKELSGLRPTAMKRLQEKLDQLAPK